MLSNEYRQMLKLAAESKNPDRIDATIKLVKHLSPKDFFKVNAEGKDIDPIMEQRVFFSRPFSTHWSGTYITTKNGYAK
jgi:hypothetical protein